MAKAATCPATLSAIGRRSHARVRLGIPARLILPNGTHCCRLLNLSISGAMIEIEPAPARGSVGLVHFGGTEASGTVVWSSSRRCGIDFVGPLPAETVAAMRRLAAAHLGIDAMVESRALKSWTGGQAPYD